MDYRSGKQGLPIGTAAATASASMVEHGLMSPSWLDRIWKVTCCHVRLAYVWFRPWGECETPHSGMGPSAKYSKYSQQAAAGRSTKASEGGG